MLNKNQLHCTVEGCFTNSRASLFNVRCYHFLNINWPFFLSFLIALLGKMHDFIHNCIWIPIEQLFANLALKYCNDNDNGVILFPCRYAEHVQCHDQLPHQLHSFLSFTC